MNTCDGIFFDVGNTLALLDDAFVVEVAGDCGAAVELESFRRCDSQVRYEIDVELLGQIESGREIGQGVVSMGPGGLLSRYFSTLLAEVGVPRDRHGEIIEILFTRDGAHPLGLWNRLEEDTEPTLARLRERGYSLGVITNSDGRAAAKLEALGIARFFDLVVDSAMVGVEKPHPRIFELALERLGLEASRSLYVGDIFSVDVLGARRAGMRAVLYDPAGLYGELAPGALASLSDVLWLLN